MRIKTNSQHDPCLNGRWQVGGGKGEVGFNFAQMVMNPPAMQETWVRSLGQEDPLEGGMATYSSVLAWRIPMDRGAWLATFHGVIKSWTRRRD